MGYSFVSASILRAVRDRRHPLPSMRGIGEPGGRGGCIPFRDSGVPAALLGDPIRFLLTSQEPDLARAIVLAFDLDLPLLND